MLLPFKAQVWSIPIILLVNTDILLLEDLPALDEFEKDVCDNHVTMDEILVSLKGMENSKSPGPDGLTKEMSII
jgi:hypothetical protein